ncbi:MAG: hypothetical protein IKI84_14730 [Clostridia bacterium]|nr:hypothetical protein [Clostridia bacterium]
MTGAKDPAADRSTNRSGYRGIPEADLKLLCKTILAEAERFYADPKNIEDFENWKREVTKNHV